MQLATCISLSKYFVRHLLQTPVFYNLLTSSFARRNERYLTRKLLCVGFQFYPFRPKINKYLLVDHLPIDQSALEYHTY